MSDQHHLIKLKIFSCNLKLIFVSISSTKDALFFTNKACINLKFNTLDVMLPAPINNY